MRFSSQLSPSNKFAYSNFELVVPKGSLLSTSPFYSYNSPSSRRGDVFTLPRLPSSVPSSVPSSRRGDAHTLPRLPSSGRGTAHTLPKARPSFSAHVPVNGSLSTAAGLILATLMVVSLFGLFLLLTYNRPQRRRDHPPQAPEDGGQLQQHQHYVLASPSAMHVMSVSAEPLPLPTASRNPIAGFPIGSSSIIFTYSELFSVTKGFSNILGEGGFGYVYKGTLPNGIEVAIKRLKSGSQQGESEFQAEVNIIRRIHHRHLVSLVGYCIEGGRRLLVYNFVPNNTLKFHLHGRSDFVKPLVGKSQPTIDWATRLKIALGSAKGFAYLHEGCHPQIIHRDIKADNILLDFEFEAQIADFGLSKDCVNSHVTTGVKGTFGYMAPEYASSGRLTYKSDVYSYGVVLLELITGRRPLDVPYLVGWARPYLKKALENGIYSELVDPRLQQNYNNHEMANMVSCAALCVQQSAELRPKMSQIVRVLEGDKPLSAYSSESNEFWTASTSPLQQGNGLYPSF